MLLDSGARVLYDTEREKACVCGWTGEVLVYVFVDGERWACPECLAEHEDGAY